VCDFIGKASEIAFFTLLLATKEHVFRHHLAAFQVDNFLEAKGDDVGAVDAAEDVVQEVDVGWIACE
jgi:hypothetical protein